MKISKFIRNKIMILIPILLLLFLCIFSAIYILQNKNPNAPPSALLNKKLPSFSTKSLYNEYVNLSSDNLKKKYTLINFFASWCAPCKIEHPLFFVLSEDFSDLFLLGINYKDKKEDAINYLNEDGNPYNFIGVDKEGKLGLEFGVIGLPETFIINENYHEASFFGQDSIMGKRKFGEPHYRLLKKQFKDEAYGNYVIMPLYPFGPYEEVLSERDELFKDLNKNGKWDTGEPFEDANNNGERDEYYPALFPDSINILGTDNQGRDVFARLIYGLKVSLSFALIVVFFSYIIGIMMGGMLGYFGGKVDLFGLRLIEIFSAMPFLFLMMILASIFKPSIILLALMYMTIVGWIAITWYVRGEFLKEKFKIRFTHFCIHLPSVWVISWMYHKLS